MTILQRIAQLVRDLREVNVILDKVDKVVYEQVEPNKAILHIKWYSTCSERVKEDSETLKNAICAEFSKDNPEIIHGISTLEDYSTYCEILIPKQIK